MVGPRWTGRTASQLARPHGWIRKGSSWGLRLESKQLCNEGGGERERTHKLLTPKALLLVNQLRNSFSEIGKNAHIFLLRALSALALGRAQFLEVRDDPEGLLSFEEGFEEGSVRASSRSLNTP